MAEPGRCPRVIEPGTEIQVGIADGCRRGARRRACADPLACNFLATEAVSDSRLCGRRAGGPTGADASEGIIVDALQDVACAVLDSPPQIVADKTMPQRVLWSISVFSTSRNPLGREHRSRPQARQDGAPVLNDLRKT